MLYRNLQSIFMLFKVVLGKQIRLFNCTETPTIHLIHAFINKVYPHVKKYSVYYLDEDNDQIVLENDLDLNVLLSGDNKKPKIFVNSAVSEAFQDTVMIELEEKVEEHVKKVEQKNGEENAIVKEQRQGQAKMEVEGKNMKEQGERNNDVIHGARCDSCGMEPITGIRFKCGFCPSFDLCQKCETDGHCHPLIKIRLNEQAPVSCKLEFCKSQAEAIAAKIKNSLILEKEKFVFESPIEREQIIISYLGNILGEDDFKRYKNFSKVCKSQTYEDLIEEYLTWTQEGSQGNIQRLFGWIRSHLAKLRDEYL